MRPLKLYNVVDAVGRQTGNSSRAALHASQSTISTWLISMLYSSLTAMFGRNDIISQGTSRLHYDLRFTSKIIPTNVGAEVLKATIIGPYVHFFTHEASLSQWNDGTATSTFIWWPSITLDCRGSEALATATCQTDVAMRDPTTDEESVWILSNNTRTTTSAGMGICGKLLKNLSHTSNISGKDSGFLASKLLCSSSAKSYVSGNVSKSIIKCHRLISLSNSTINNYVVAFKE